VVLYKGQIIILLVLRRDVLDIVHSAHQGTSSMEARVSDSVWWPGLKEEISSRRMRCQG
jgi:hypothetical protein